MQQVRTEFGSLNGCGDGIERCLLRGVQYVSLPVQRGQMREMKIGRTLFDADQFPFDQRGQRGLRHGQTAQLGDGQLIAGTGELSHYGLLVFIQLGQARAFDQHGITNGAASVARRGAGFAHNPLLAEHSGEEFARGSSGRAQRGKAYGVSAFEIVEDFVLDVLLFGRATGATRRSLLCAVEERLTALICDAEQHLLAHFTHQRKHGAQDFADRRDVIERDPLCQFEKLRREDGFFIENVEEQLCFDRRRFVVNAQDDACQFLIAEGDENARANGGYRVVNRIGEGAIERDGQRNVAVSGHGALGESITLGY